MGWIETSWFYLDGIRKIRCGILSYTAKVNFWPRRWSNWTNDVEDGEAVLYAASPIGMPASEGVLGAKNEGRGKSPAVQPLDCNLPRRFQAIFKFRGVICRYSCVLLTASQTNWRIALIRKNDELHVGIWNGSTVFAVPFVYPAIQILKKHNLDHFQGLNRQCIVDRYRRWQWDYEN